MNYQIYTRVGNFQLALLGNFQLALTKPANTTDKRPGHGRHQRRRGHLRPPVLREKIYHPGPGLQPRLIRIEIQPVNALDSQCHLVL